MRQRWGVSVRALCLNAREDTLCFVKKYALNGGIYTYHLMMTTAPLIPAEQGLANSWRTWRRILYTFYKQRGPVRILEIGAYRGEATAWFLRNLCGHAESRVYAVDTFEGSAEYTDTNFSKIEQAFQASICATGRQSRVVKLKMLSYKALLQLNTEFNRQPYFDVVLIDASHEAADVMMDGVMAFPLLKVGGVMIFDDYKWEKLVQAYYRPKVAIDGFIDVMRPYVRVLKRGWQLLLEKTERQDAPVVTEAVQKRVREFVASFLREAHLALSGSTQGARIQPDQLHVRPVSTKTATAEPVTTQAHSFSYAPESVGYHLSLLVKPHIPSDFKHLSVLHKSLEYNRVVTRFQQMGLQRSHYTHFANYLRLVHTFAPKRAQSWTYLNCRSAYDFCGKFYTDNALRNYTRPIAALAYQPHRFYDLSCTNQFDTFKHRSLYGAPLTRERGMFHSYQLNQWSLRNWVDIARALESHIDVLNVHCLIPVTQLFESYAWSTSSASSAADAAALSVQRDKCALVTAYFALLVQRVGGACCLIVAHKTLHTPLMVQLLWVLHRLYANVQCRFSSYKGSTHRIHIDCARFRGLQPSVRKALYSTLLQMDDTFLPITSGGSADAPQVSLGVSPSNAFKARVRAYNKAILHKQASVHSYYAYVADLDKRLANVPSDTRYQLVESHQIHVYVRWCNELNVLYKRLSGPTLPLARSSAVSTQRPSPRRRTVRKGNRSRTRTRKTS